MKPKRINSLVAIELRPGRIGAVEIRRQGDGASVANTIDSPLAIDVFTGDSELAAREIRGLLQQSGIRSHDCVLCLPLDRLLIHNADITGIEEEDIESLLTLEAERRLPYSPEDITLASTRCEEANGKRMAILSAMPIDQIAALERVMKLAKLKVFSIAPALPALLEPEGDKTSASLLAGENSLDLAIGSTGGMSVMRTFGSAWKAALDMSDDGALDELIREWRLTMRRLPTPVLNTLKEIHVFGDEPQRKQLIDMLNREAAALGVSFVKSGVDASGRIDARGSGNTLPALTRLAAKTIGGEAPALEFWRPHDTQWSSLMRRLQAKGMGGKIGAGAGAAVLLFVMIFLFQGWRLGRLETRWDTMRDEVERLETVRDGLRLRSNWTSNTPESLETIKAITSAFPEYGTVWARTLEYHHPNTVKCTGFAKNNSNILTMLEPLGETPGVEDLQVVQMRGDDPVQFSLSYQWNARQAHVAE